MRTQTIAVLPLRLAKTIRDNFGASVALFKLLWQVVRSLFCLFVCVFVRECFVNPQWTMLTRCVQTHAQRILRLPLDGADTYR